ncbi:MAG: dephospho-CoA kinase [Mollicutes bacterium]|nr:dephospho-CoA kinase [Mollicutes bacterium]
MNRLIGITGGMSSGKSTISKKIVELNPDYEYIDVDNFRRNLFNDLDYVNRLKESIIGLSEFDNIDSSILNKYIYDNEENMSKYKDILYKYLFSYISNIKDKTIIVDWALILKDRLLGYFDKVIYIDTSVEERLNRLSKSDLPKQDILKRFGLQKIDSKVLESEKVIVINNDYNIEESVIKVEEFINKIECKFTLPNNEGKAIWEITHKCNYGCSYCIFSCKTNSAVKEELTTEECFHVIDELVKNGFKHLKITGGEPFIRKDILDILKYASKNLITDISTNASLITVDIVKELNKIPLKMIHVSLDGNKEAHESVRGKNTYDRTIRGLECLKKSKNKVRIGSVIHINNEKTLEDLINSSIDYNADEIIFSIMEPVEGQSKAFVKTISNDKLISTIKVLNKKYNKKININYNFGRQPNYVSICPGGDKFIYINNLGQVSPCPWVYENDKSCVSIRSLRNNKFKDILKDSKLSTFVSKKIKGRCYGKIQ